MSSANAANAPNEENQSTEVDETDVEICQKSNTNLARTKSKRRAIERVSKDIWSTIFGYYVLLDGRVVNLLSVPRFWKEIGEQTPHLGRRMLLLEDTIPLSLRVRSVHARGEIETVERFRERSGASLLQLTLVLGRNKEQSPSPLIRVTLFKSVTHHVLPHITFLCIIVNPKMSIKLIEESPQDVFSGTLEALESLMIASVHPIGNLYALLEPVIRMINASSLLLSSIYLDNVNLDFITKVSALNLWTRASRLTIMNEFDALDTATFERCTRLEFLSFSGKLAYADTNHSRKVEPKDPPITAPVHDEHLLNALRRLPDLTSLQLDHRPPFSKMFFCEMIPKKLEESDSQAPEHLFELARLHEQRFDWAGRYLNINNAVSNQEAGLKLLADGDTDKPGKLCDLMRMCAKLKEATKERLLEDLQQLANYIRKPKWNVDIVDLMEDVITILKENDANKLCGYICDHSIRLGTYCEALRSQVGESMDRNHLRALYREIVTTEREVSAAYKNIAAKYERLYKLWREKREQISNMLSLLDSITSRNHAEDLQTQIQRVDEGLDAIRKTLEDQKRTLKDYFDSCKISIARTNSKGGPPSEPVPPDNPSLEANPSESLPNPSDLPKAVDAGKEKLCQIRAVVGKARYTKKRKGVEDKLSTTATQLEGLHRDSQKYQSTVRELLESKPTQRVKWWNRRRGPSHQLPNFVKSMTSTLAEIQRGFDKYKHSILGLIFRPLGDMIDDLKPYFSQVGQEVIRKRLHPDMILYEAAFLFLIKSSKLGLTEQIGDFKSRLEAMAVSD
ncbi:hypothetical protein FRC14_004705 [Serendipita sp. 396]|nr:hypothetical protein FRC14_004705 [Serendipita sp. 396]KAG8781673.1 hypothetical protein FRC15_008273 [Serendipita sp. 397]KAG8797958.1 hypothetical protein FRC16_008289 [Serendipita sp. 398]KAG8825025.1 hypothetical protein FRC19_000583 [Serendipita sp. 401]KAG8866414.1 hypothetical protein FRC20_008601 [Serendipita sp. 405]KAG9052468.1 hypothetical protein FS842_009822 [Serendipita sp. 407]